MAYFTWNDRVAKLRDGRLIAKGQNYRVVTTGCVGVTIRVPDLRYIEQVLDVEFDLQGFNCTSEYIIGPDMNKKISGNLVGISLYVVSAGATLTVRVIAIGPP